MRKLCLQRHFKQNKIAVSSLTYKYKSIYCCMYANTTFRDRYFVTINIWF